MQKFFRLGVSVLSVAVLVIAMAGNVWQTAAAASAKAASNVATKATTTAMVKDAAASTCVTPYTISQAPAVSQTPSSTIGQIAQGASYVQNNGWGEYNDQVDTMAYDQSTNTLYMGGLIPGYVWQGTTYVRHNVLAINATTGQPTSFSPNVDGEVLTMSLSCSGSLLYLGGSFHHVDTAVRNYAAKVTVAGTDQLADVASWNPNPNAKVQSIAIMHDHLVISGDFTSIGGLTRPYVTSIGQITATPDSWLDIPVGGGEPSGDSTTIYPMVRQVSANPAGTVAVMIGNFSTVGGAAHRRIALLNLSDSHATVLPWATVYTSAGANGNANVGSDCSAGDTAPELDVAWTPGGTRFITVSTGGPHFSSTGMLCDSASKWDGTDISDSNAKPMAQQFTGGDTLSAGVCSSISCFFSGHNRWANNPPRQPVVVVAQCDPDVAPLVLTPGDAGYDCEGPGAVPRPGIMEVSIGSMQATSWNSGRSRQAAMHNVMIFTPQGLWLGTDGDTAGGQPHNDLVLWPFEAATK